MGSQCNAPDRLAPPPFPSQLFLKRWLFWLLANSLPSSPYTNFPARCSPPSSKEAKLRGRDKRATSAFPRAWRREPMSHRQDKKYSLQADREHPQDEEEDGRRADGSLSRGLPVAHLHWSKLQGNVPEAVYAGANKTRKGSICEAVVPEAEKRVCPGRHKRGEPAHWARDRSGRCLPHLPWDWLEAIEEEEVF